MGHPFASPVPSAHPATLGMPAVSLTVSDVMLRSETVPMYRTNAWWAYTKYKEYHRINKFTYIPSDAIWK
ncbi:uncharacterized protein SEPMUDRAFT_127546 [Sphaerulina musiva SO2202]|uniref:Uncharacterized protein n=1 Tax=Sphaerulina musiva (strain SO2202) TaxID=692275 RepID=M3CZT4_SPHMS|nr:uncharacterized protein SEPMUDRAFT_127546 [Sphaerulina musiva SO2202]EMF09758.1 hypothetical protein SEPMUDRAFT_127546 [Sphaerulina musiva SO2202]